LIFCLLVCMLLQRLMTLGLTPILYFVNILCCQMSSVCSTKSLRKGQVFNLELRDASKERTNNMGNEVICSHDGLLLLTMQRV